MRIMATSDLHGNLEGLDPKGADVVVLAGGGVRECMPMMTEFGGKFGEINRGTLTQ